MLSRAPGFIFYSMDVEAIMLETGLNKAQVQVWAENFRMWYETEKDRIEFLRVDDFDKVTRPPLVFGCRIFFPNHEPNRKIVRD
jgi:hypothetical protein